MVEKDDWRIDDPKEYLQNASLYKRDYKAQSERWDHEHCRFCWKKFMESGGDGILTTGYATEDNICWICPECYEDFKEMFGWTLVEE